MPSKRCVRARQCGDACSELACSARVTETPMTAPVSVYQQVLDRLGGREDPNSSRWVLIPDDGIGIQLRAAAFHAIVDAALSGEPRVTQGGAPALSDVRGWEVIDARGQCHSLVGSGNKEAAERNAARYNASKDERWSADRPYTLRPLYASAAPSPPAGKEPDVRTPADAGDGRR